MLKNLYRQCWRDCRIKLAIYNNCSPETCTIKHQCHFDRYLKSFVHFHLAQPTGLLILYCNISAILCKTFEGVIGHSWIGPVGLHLQYNMKSALTGSRAMDEQLHSKHNPKIAHSSLALSQVWRLFASGLGRLNFIHSHSRGNQQNTLRKYSAKQCSSNMGVNNICLPCLHMGPPTTEQTFQWYCQYPNNSKHITFYLSSRDGLSALLSLPLLDLLLGNSPPLTWFCDVILCNSLCNT